MKNYKLFFIVLFFLVSYSSIAQFGNTQYHKNSLLPVSKILSFSGSVNSAEETLLLWDFGLVDQVMQGKLYFNFYRLDHSYNPYDNGFLTDIWGVTNDASIVVYMTSSSSNYLEYKKRFKSYGFREYFEKGKMIYTLQKGDTNFRMEFKSEVYHDGTPNYKLFIIAQKDSSKHSNFFERRANKAIEKL